MMPLLMRSAKDFRKKKVKKRKVGESLVDFPKVAKVKRKSLPPLLQLQKHHLDGARRNPALCRSLFQL
jgi:hypothetical protein